MEDIPLPKRNVECNSRDDLSVLLGKVLGETRYVLVKIFTKDEGRPYTFNLLLDGKKIKLAQAKDLAESFEMWGGVALSILSDLLDKKMIVDVYPMNEEEFREFLKSHREVAEVTEDTNIEEVIGHKITTEKPCECKSAEKTAAVLEREHEKVKKPKLVVYTKPELLPHFKKLYRALVKRAEELGCPVKEVSINCREIRMALGSGKENLATVRVVVSGKNVPIEKLKHELEKVAFSMVPELSREIGERCIIREVLIERTD